MLHAALAVPSEVVSVQGSAKNDSECNSAALPVQAAPNQSRTVDCLVACEKL